MSYKLKQFFSINHLGYSQKLKSFIFGLDKCIFPPLIFDIHELISNWIHEYIICFYHNCIQPDFFCLNKNYGQIFYVDELTHATTSLVQQDNGVFSCGNGQTTFHLAMFFVAAKPPDGCTCFLVNGIVGFFPWLTSFHDNNDGAILISITSSFSSCPKTF